MLTGIGAGLYFTLRGLPNWVNFGSFILGGIGIALVLSGLIAMLRSKAKPTE